MKVVLLSDQKGLGVKGDVVEVKDGYAINYLFPKKFAVPATSEVVQKFRAISERRRKETDFAEKFVRDLAKKIEKRTFRIKVKASSGGKVYGSVNLDDVVASLKKQWKVDKTPVEVKLGIGQPIKELGKYPIEVEVTGAGSGGKAEIILEVVGE